ncbi:MAG: 2-isopropylmalate synthase [bacterium]|nr:MAG: 2-isopropylmalate synthase [bacterium]
MSENIIIFDTTLRDGEQSPGASMNLEEKIQVAQQLERMNVDVIEAGFAIASEGDFEAVRAVARKMKKASVASLCRANRKDIDRAWEALKEAKKPRIHTFLATSDIHVKLKLQKTHDQVRQAAVDAVRHAVGYIDDVEFSAEDAARSNVSYLCEVIEAVIEAGAKTVNIPDTVGYAIPDEFGALIATIRERVPNIDRAVLSVHCHNDLGLAVANSLAAIQAGARQVECTINGIGERAGNASLEEIVMGIRTRHDHLKVHTGIKTEEIYRASRLVSGITGILVQQNKAIVGANAFAHEAGIHQDGMLKDPTTYEIMTPESVGIKESSLVLGKHSGRHAFRKRLEDLGIELTDDEIQTAFVAFKNLADRKKTVYDEDIEALIAEEILRLPDRYKLVSVTFTSGTGVVPSATVEMEVEGKTLTRAEFGDGPVDAVFKAIKKICKSRAKLLRFTVSAITGGADALGGVTVRIKENGYTIIGQGASPDIIVASARAFINALNKLEYRKRNVMEEERPTL